MNGQRAQTGYRYNANATSATIDKLDPAVAYTFEVKAITVDGKSSPAFTVNTANAGGETQTPGAAAALTVLPAASLNGTPVAASSVTASTTAGTQIFFAVDTAGFAGGVLTMLLSPTPAPSRSPSQRRCTSRP